MTQYIVRRLIHAVFVIWGCATLVFFLIRMIPGDPVLLMLGPEYSPAAAEALRAKLGLDEPVLVQYFTWLGNMLVGDLGTSITGSETVAGAILTSLPKTLSLTLLGFVIAVVIAVPTGIMAAIRRNSPLDYLV
ncbi:MAG: ABC transporter permease, partial [Chloroflexia bacterium]|nr:ABC transporter permease [Chloroflexia bacterium]